MTLLRLIILCVLLFFNLLLGFICLHSWRVVTIISSNPNDTVFWNTSSLPHVILTNRTPVVNRASHPPQTSVNSEPVFPHPYDYIIPNRDFCTRGSHSKKGKLALIILVCTSPGNFVQRQTIRETWASIPSLSNNTGAVRVGFLLGETSNSSLQAKIMEEAALHVDIIQEDFVDSYQNLTLKSVMLLKWTTTFCPNVHFILKTDDDMFINIPNLLTTLVKLPHRSSVMYGVLFRKAKPNRNVNAKWFVPKTQFEGDVFPDYLSGTGYVMSRDVVPKLLEVSYNLPFLVMEDVFITGLCASQAGIKRVGVKGFAHWHRPPTGCSFRDAVTGHHVTVKEMKKIWNELQNKALVCKIPKKGS